MIGHAIQRVCFEFDVSPGTLIVETQSCLSAFKETQLEATIESCLHKYDPGDRVVSFDVLELDLGELTIDQLTTELANRITFALSASLERADGAQESLEIDAVAEVPQRLRQLAYFFENGVLHWTASAGAESIDALVLEAVVDDAEGVRLLLEKTGGQAAVRQRIARQLRPTTLLRLVRLLAPRDADMIIDTAAAIRRIHTQRPVIANDQGEFALTIWDGVLAYLLADRRQGFNARHFIRILLGTIAGRYRFDAATLPGALQVRQQLVSSPFNPLSAMLETLDLKPVERDITETPVASVAGNLSLILYYIREGSVPADQPTQSDASIAALFHNVLASEPAALAESLSAGILQSAPLRRRLLQVISVEDLARLLRFLDPATAVLLDARRQTLSADEATLPEVSGTVSSPSSASLSLILHYIREGSVPAGQPTQSEASIAALFHSVLASEPAALAEGLSAEVLQSAPQRLRLLRLVSDADFNRLLDAIGPSSAAILGGQGQHPLEKEVEDSKTNGVSAGDVDLLVHLLKSGELAWWSRRLLGQDLGQWLSNLLREDGDNVVTALQKVADRPATIERLIWYFPWEGLSRLVETLVPDYAGAVISYLLGGEQVRFGESRAQLSPDAIRGAHWQAILSRLLDPHAARFEFAGFISDTGRRVAHRLNLSHEVYIDALSESVGLLAAKGNRFAPLQEVLDTLTRRTRSDDAAEAVVSRPGEGSSLAVKWPPFMAAPVSSIAPQRLDDTLFLTRHFLQYGSIPVGSKAETVDDIEERISALLDSRADDLQDFFLAAVEEPVMRARLISRLSHGLLRRIVSRLDENLAGALATLDLLEDPVRTIALDMPQERWRRVAFDTLFTSIHGKPSAVFDGAAFVRRLLQRVAREQKIEYSGLLVGLVDQGAEGNFPPELARMLIRLKREVEADTPLESEAVPPPSQWLWASGEGEDSAGELPLGEPYYLDNAGLVLLWPFLPRFFGVLDMLEEGRFRDAAAARRAVHLLQYLVSGETDAPEFRLLLNKLLCGVGTADFVERAIQPTATETQLVEDVLYGVTQNWTQLQNTSVAGLRETFLQREGRLTGRDDAWSLAVAAKPYDMLLDSLPWSISTIRLGWMTEVLYVQWR